jgi:hypothetical protein
VRTRRGSTGALVGIKSLQKKEMSDDAAVLDSLDSGHTRLLVRAQKIPREIVGHGRIDKMIH